MDYRTTMILHVQAIIEYIDDSFGIFFLFYLRIKTFFKCVIEDKTKMRMKICVKNSQTCQLNERVSDSQDFKDFRSV